MALPIYAQNYHHDIKKFGPLPPEWKVTMGQNGRDPHYSSAAGASTGSLHPCSPQGRLRNINFRTYQDTRLQFPGIPQPPIIYNYANLMWEPHISLLKALTSALGAQLEDMTEDKVLQSLQQAKEDPCYSNILYHPGDRDLIISDQEPSISAVARSYGRNLIVVSPRVESLGQWDHIWFGAPSIPVLARWSTGKQDDLKPIILGFLPMYKEGSSKKGGWYVIKPYGNHVALWNTFWTR